MLLNDCINDTHLAMLVPGKAESWNLFIKPKGLQLSQHNEDKPQRSCRPVVKSRALESYAGVQILSCYLEL